jgi:hypothetical protein
MKSRPPRRWWRVPAIVVAATVLPGAVAQASPPPMTLPSNTTFQATGPSGAVATFTVRSGPSDTTSCSPSSGSTFPIGDTTVTCTATDPQTNDQTTGTFTVVVEDVPRFAPYPAQVVSRAARPQPIRVGYARPVAVDYADSSVPVACAPAAGSLFPVGWTKVTCTATSSHHDTRSLSFYVRVLGRLRPPGVSNLTAEARGRAIALRWLAPRSSDISAVKVTRRPGLTGAGASVVYTGRGSTFIDDRATAGVYYTYTVATIDPGGRPSPSRVASAGFALPELFLPRNGARLLVAPTLRWLPSRGATYYNVQLWRGNARVLSLWPQATTVRVPRTWTFAGKHYTLAPGVYTWYVWPGLGSLAAARYGKILGHARFTISKG